MSATWSFVSLDRLAGGRVAQLRLPGAEEVEVLLQLGNCALALSEIRSQVVPETSPVNEDEADNDGEAGDDDTHDGDQLVLVGVDEVMVRWVHEPVFLDRSKSSLKGHVVTGAVVQLAKPVHDATERLRLQTVSPTSKGHV